MGKNFKRFEQINWTENKITHSQQYKFELIKNEITEVEKTKNKRETLKKKEECNITALINIAVECLFILFRYYFILPTILKL